MFELWSLRSAKFERGRQILILRSILFYLSLLLVEDIKQIKVFKLRFYSRLTSLRLLLTVDVLGFIFKLGQLYVSEEYLPVPSL